MLGDLVASADPDPVVAQDVIDETGKRGSARRLAGEREEQLAPAAIVRWPGIGRASVYRLLGKEKGAGLSANGDGNADQT